MLRESLNSVPSDDLYITTNIPDGSLPPFLERAISVEDKPWLRDILLFSTLTACSYALPNVRIRHAKDEYYPNLMTLVVAPSGAGKGKMKLAGKLIEPIDELLQLFDRRAFIPANSSSAAFMDLLLQNGEKGFMMETEMSVLSQIWKRDYGNYSYIFRQAFEHERVTLARKGAGGGLTEPKEVLHPRLSVLLSGTPKQVEPLLGSRENGLAARFLPYVITDVDNFDGSVFFHGDTVLPNSGAVVFSELAQDLLERWRWLKTMPTIYWSLTDDQARNMAALFEDDDHLVFEAMQMPLDFKSAIKRMAVTIKRIGAILTVLRLPINDPSIHPTAEADNILYCSDEDFDTLVLLTKKLLCHAGLMTLMLPEEPAIMPVTMVEPAAADRKTQELLAALPEKFSKADAVALGERMGMAERTVKEYLTGYCSNHLIERLTRGQYRKK